MSSNQQNLILRVESCFQVSASHPQIGADEEGCDNGPGKRPGARNQGEMIEGSNVASGLTVSTQV